MSWGDKIDRDRDGEEREVKEARPFLDPHWSEALRQISHHCGLMDDHIEKNYAKLLNKNDTSGLKDEHVFSVPQPDLVIRNGARPAKAIEIHHEPGKLFRIKVVLIDYGNTEIYFVSNTSARHFYDDSFGEETTDDGRRFPDRRATENCTLMLRCNPDEVPRVQPCCNMFRRCIKKRDLLCKFEQDILDSAPARRTRNDGGGGGGGGGGGASNGFGGDSGGNGFGGGGGGGGGGWDNANSGDGGGWGASAEKTDNGNAGTSW